MKMNEIYEAPAVEIVKVMVEAGFAGSPTGPDENDPNFGGGLDEPFA